MENYPFFFNPSLGKAEQYFMAMTPPLTRWQMAIMSKSIRGAVNKKQYIYIHCPNRRGGGQPHFKKLKRNDFLTKVGEAGGHKKYCQR